MSASNGPAGSMGWEVIGSRLSMRDEIVSQSPILTRAIM